MKLQKRSTSFSAETSIFHQGMLLAERIPEADPTSPFVLASIKTSCSILFDALSIPDSPLIPSSGLERVTSEGWFTAVVTVAWALRLRLLWAFDPAVRAQPVSNGPRSASDAQAQFVAFLNLDEITNDTLATRLTEAWQEEHEIELFGGDPNGTIDRIAYHLDGMVYWCLDQCFYPDFGRIYEPDELTVTPWPPEDPAEQTRLRQGVQLLRDLTSVHQKLLFYHLQNLP